MQAHLPKASHKSRDNKIIGLLALTGLLTAAIPVLAAAKVEADPNKDYRVSPETGPWMVCAASYTGPNAQTLAKQLVLQIRQRDNLPAWYFDRGEKERREQEERLNFVRQQSDPGARIRKVRIEDQYAVLIGGYPDMDAARKALSGIKKLKPPELKLGGNVATMDRTIDPQDGKILEVNPFASAFVSRNPTVAYEQPQEKGDDPFLKKLNAGEEYSLLKCRKPYTLAVKVYHGFTATQAQSGGSTFLDKVGIGGKAPHMLSACAHDAHNLAELLHKHMGMESYVLHDRRCSYVTVGSFDGLDDPEMQRLQNRLATCSFSANGSANGPDVLQLLKPAQPMRVPKP